MNRLTVMTLSGEVKIQTTRLLGSHRLDHIKVTRATQIGQINIVEAPAKRLRRWLRRKRIGIRKRVTFPPGAKRTTFPLQISQQIPVS